MSWRKRKLAEERELATLTIGPVDHGNGFTSSITFTLCDSTHFIQYFTSG